MADDSSSPGAKVASASRPSAYEARVEGATDGSVQDTPAPRGDRRRTAAVAAARLSCSVIIPVLNEEACLPELTDRLLKTLDQSGESFEVIFVDDGSTDGGPAFLREVIAREPRVQMIRLLGHFGQHAAISAGIERSHGDIVILLDADLQSDPEALPAFKAKVREGYDLVSGWRTTRTELGLTRRLASEILTWLINRSTGAILHDHGCGFKAMTRQLAERISQYGQMRRFLPALLARLARNVTEIPVRNHPSPRGGSRYSLSRLMGLTLEFLIEFSIRPFQIVGALGLAALLIGILGGVAYAVCRLLGVPAMDRLLASIVLLVFSGFHVTLLGLLGEYLIRTYHSTQRIPLFVIDEVVSHPRAVPDA
jgi:hypothetical protein